MTTPTQASAPSFFPAENAPRRNSALIRGEYRLGAETELLVLSDGTAQFDGGAMFGVVPKPLWSRGVQADEQNRITIGLNTVVVRTAGRTVVIETGFGEKLSPKTAGLYGAQGRLMEAFADAGIALDSVDMVINTHLHWDHCGWNTRYAPGTESAGELARPVVPTFPNARYFAHAGEIAHGRARHERDAVSYVADNYEPLLASGQMEALDVREGEERAIAPGIAVELFPGHTRQLMAVHIEDGASGERACYISDLVPTTNHLPLAWGMGFDLDPLRVVEEKKRFYARAIREEWLVLFTHEAAEPAGFLEAAKSGAALRPKT